MNSWSRASLGELAESIDYGVTASAIQQPRGPKFLRITDIQNGRVDWDSVPWCECDSQSATQARLRSGDIVFARTGATTGKSFLIRQCPDDAVFASYLIRVRLKDSTEPRYVSHFFQTEDYWSQITKSARGVAQPGVNATTLKSLSVPLPPLAEQRRISGILDKAASLDTLTVSVPPAVKVAAATANLDDFVNCYFGRIGGTSPRRRPARRPALQVTSRAKRVTRTALADKGTKESAVARAAFSFR
jgi:type I restriction enzyme S subunit